MNKIGMEIKMKIWHISDTHTYHRSILIPTYYDGSIDTVVHSGDATTSRNSIENTKELLGFLDWFKNLPFKNKIFVAGNHDVVTERFRYWPEDIEGLGIHYLENNHVIIDGVKIWGSPYTPSFGKGWAWNMSRNKINRVWEAIPKDTDVLVTHGPPKGILDHTLDKNGDLKSVGDSSLYKAICKTELQAHLFGHVHNSKWIKNSGVFISGERWSKNIIKYSNGSVVEDGKGVEHLQSWGNVIDVNN